jgi:hypothetical protein
MKLSPKNFTRVADPGCLSRIWLFSIPDPVSRVKWLWFPEWMRIKKLKYFYPKKNVSMLSEIWSGIFITDPDPGSRFFTHPGSRGQRGTGSRIRNTELYYGNVHQLEGSVRWDDLGFESILNRWVLIWDHGAGHFKKSGVSGQLFFT